MKKHTKHTFQRLNADQVKAYYELRDAQQIAWLTRNKSLAAEIGQRIAELRHINLAYRQLDY